jgi:hypothetical protein
MFSPTKAQEDVRKALSYLANNQLEKYGKQLASIVEMLESSEFNQYMRAYSSLAWNFPNRMKSIGLMENDFDSQLAYEVSLSPFRFPYASFLFQAKMGMTTTDNFQMKLIDLEGMLETIQLVDENMSYTARRA